MRGWALVLVGCTSGAETDDKQSLAPDADTDADTDSDVDADTDADTDSDIPVEPCPFAGEWTLAEVTCSDVPIDLTGTVTATGTADLCHLELDVLVDECALVERVDLHAWSFDLWEAFTDGAGNPECRASEPGPRSLGRVLVEQGGSVQFTIGVGNYLQITLCPQEQTLTLTPLP